MKNEDFFSSGSDGMYGHVDGDRPADMGQAVKSDPFESVLALCRQLGLFYRVTMNADGKWNCQVGSSNFPGDFHSQGSSGHDRTRKFGMIGCDDRAHGVRVAVSLAMGALRTSCEQYRDMVSHTTEYRSWFKADGK